MRNKISDSTSMNLYKRNVECEIKWAVAAFVLLMGSWCLAQTEVEATRVMLVQLDPSSALLLDRGAGAVNRDSGIDSGRYSIPRSSDSGRDRSNQKDNSKADRSASKGEGQTPRSDRQDRVRNQKIQGQVEAQKGAAESQAATSVVVENSPASPLPADSGGSSSGVGGGPSEKSVREGELRPPALQIDVNTGYLYSDYESNFAYRDFVAGGSWVGISGGTYLTQNWSVSGEYGGTIGGDVRDSATGSRHVAAGQQRYEVAVQMHRESHAGSTVGSLISDLSFGVSYYGYEFNVPRDAQFRPRLSTSGILFSVEAMMFAATNWRWRVRGFLGPRLSQQESQTAVDIQSGNLADCSLVGLSLERRLNLDKTNSIYFRLSIWLEKSFYSGTATRANPSDGQTPSGVSVAHSSALLQFGYGWAK